MIPKHKLIGLVLFALPLFSLAQENSPYSRYGIGNIVPSGNIANRGMGGISAGTLPQAINFINPATYSYLQATTLDLGTEVTSRTIKSLNPVDKFTATNAIFSYIQIGIPLLGPTNKKAIKKDMSWGLNFGLRPVSRINYKIEKDSRNSIDSISTIYEGDGGVNEAFVGTGIRIKNFSLGINAGYLFGNKNYSTRLAFLNDTVTYYSSNSATKTSFGGAFISGGFQYVAKINKSALRIGGYGKLQQKYDASQDIIRETFSYNVTTGNPDRIDSVSVLSNQKGKVQLPSTYGIGFSVENQHLLFGLDYEATNWNNYSFYGQKDLVKNNWTLKGGVQFLPGTITSKKYWDFVRYRAGFYFGPDYITADKNLPTYGITVGGGFPLKLRHAFYDYQYSIMNIAVDYGSRGNNNNNIRENTFRVSVGFTLSDLWFRRYKYD